MCAEAEITTIVSDLAPAAAPVYLSATPRSFERWAQQHAGQQGGEGEEEGGHEGNGKVAVR